MGVGGSLIIIPALTILYGPRQHLYQAAAMIVNFSVVAPAALWHLRTGTVLVRAVMAMAPAAVTGAVIGVALSEYDCFRGDGQAYLTILFAVLLVYCAANITAKSFASGRPEQRGNARNSSTWRIGVQAGFPTGLLGGLLGIGGGVVCVPMQSQVFGVPLRNAIANSSTTIVCLSVVGAICKNYALVHHHPEYQLAESIRLAVSLIPTAVVGSMIGSRLVTKLPIRLLRVAFALFLLAAAFRMTSIAFSQFRLLD